MPNKKVHLDCENNPRSSDFDIEEAQIKIVNKVPNRYWRWVVLLSAIFIRVIVSGTYSSFGLFIKRFSNEFAVSPSTLGWMVSIHSCLSIIVAPLATYLALKLGHRLTVVFGLIMGGIGFGASYFYPHIWFIFISGSVVNAIGQGFVNTCSTIILTNYFEKHLPIILGIFACGSSLAPFLITPLIRYFLHTFGWRVTRLIYGGFYLASIVFSLTFKPIFKNSMIEMYRKFDKEESKSNHDIQLINIVKQNESTMNNFFGSQTSKVCTFISTANIASNIAKHSEMSNVYSSNLSVYLKNPESDEFHCNKDLVNINVPIMMGMSIASNLHIKAIIGKLSAVEINLTGAEKSSPCVNQVENQKYDSLFRNKVFLLFLTVNLFTSLGHDSTFVYVKSKAISDGILEINTIYLPMCIGLGSMIGRVTFGYVGSRKYINIYNLYAACLILSGGSLAFSVIAWSFPLMIAYTIIFGVFIGGYSSLNTAVLASIVDIFNFSRGLTLIYFTQAFGLLFGVPIFCYIYQATVSYNWSFLTSGLLIMLGGIILVPANLSKNFRNNQSRQ